MGGCPVLAYPFAWIQARTLVDTTEATSSTPVMMLMTSLVTFARRRALPRSR